MYKVLSIVFASLVLISCNKDRYTSEPQLKFKGFKPSVGNANYVNTEKPIVIFEITDKEGDVGFIAGKDTSKIYIKNPATGNIDSTKLFPDFSSVAGKNMLVTAEIEIKNILPAGPSRPRPSTDTVRLEVYITDFAKHKSNVMYTSDPFLYYFP